MSDLNVIRAWKDAKYRRTLSAAEQARLPDNPAGPVELTDSDLRRAGGYGGGDGMLQTTIITCTATIGPCCPNGTSIVICTTLATRTAPLGL
jgi:mersacidin/lichenicidin family type 2 lantibiotic